MFGQLYDAVSECGILLDTMTLGISECLNRTFLSLSLLSSRSFYIDCYLRA